MILIVEDNKDVNHMLSEALANAGYDSKSAYDGLTALNEVKRKEPDMILLDLMIPYKSGDQLLKEIRTFSDVPVIVISAKDMVGTKIDLLKMGADDYITKPFDLDEVIARVESNLRRSKKTTEKSKAIIYKNLRIDTESKQVTVDDKEVEFTAKEYCILEAMAANPSKVYTKANLYEIIWGEEYLGDDNTIKTHISNIRSKLKKADSKQEYIETVWGLGYRMSK